LSRNAPKPNAADCRCATTIGGIRHRRANIGASLTAVQPKRSAAHSRSAPNAGTAHENAVFTSISKHPIINHYTHWKKKRREKLLTIVNARMKVGVNNLINNNNNKYKSINCQQQKKNTCLLGNDSGNSNRGLNLFKYVFVSSSTSCRRTYCENERTIHCKCAPNKPLIVALHDRTMHAMQTCLPLV
jgi:hypothetical protein